MSKLLLVLSFVFHSVTWAKVEVVLGKVDLKHNENAAAFLPQSPDDEILISRKQYVLSYNQMRRSPNWVAWELDATDIGNSGRSDVFWQDEDLQKYLSRTGKGSAVSPTEYKGSCFDRGHQVPSNDRTSRVTDNEYTFTMSNMIPQTAAMNRGNWWHLEAYTRAIVKNGKRVYVISGPVYDEDFGRIGTGRDIPVPSKNFKVIFILGPNQTPKQITATTPSIAVMIPNVLSDGSKPVQTSKVCDDLEKPVRVDRDEWKKYKTTVAEIERATGLKLTSD